MDVWGIILAGVIAAEARSYRLGQAWVRCPSR